MDLFKKNCCSQWQINSSLTAFRDVPFPSLEILITSLKKKIVLVFFLRLIRGCSLSCIMQPSMSVRWEGWLWRRERGTQRLETEVGYRNVTSLTSVVTSSVLPLEPWETADTTGSTWVRLEAAAELDNYRPGNQIDFCRYLHMHNVTISQKREYISGGYS